MKIGFIGLGKLGLPVALAIETKGYEVIGYDVSGQVKSILDSKKLPYREIWAQECLEKSRIQFANVEEVVRQSEIIFVPIQTPHSPEYEGITRIPSQKMDFDYSFLKQGLKMLSDEIDRQGEDKVVIVISTVLPGTIRREIKPILSRRVKLCYNPFFIAMGLTMKDFLYPEFVLFGVDDNTAAEKAELFYKTIHNAPFYKTTIENAELIKVVYNTFISTKISFVNTIMEMCYHLPNTNVDDVMNALKLATVRIISNNYLMGGMGDGGGCHPRDNIALSWLSEKLGLSYNWFENIMKQREKQTEWMADLVEKNARGRPIVILGKSFKPETNITTGSPAILLRNILEERGCAVTMYDPYVDGDVREFGKPKLYFIGTRHPHFVTFPYEAGSMIIDPWRYIPVIKNVEVLRIGDHGKRYASS